MKKNKKRYLNKLRKVLDNPYIENGLAHIYKSKKRIKTTPIRGEKL